MAVARGDEPADLVLAGGKVLSVFTKEWLEVVVAVKDGHVVGLGSYKGRELMDVSGSYLVPGFIDAHMHIESSKLTVDEFARAVVPHGTTAVVADPHEIANVLGTDGIHWLLDCCTDLPLDVYVMASSCVPASRFESPRRPFTTGDIESINARFRKDRWRMIHPPTHLHYFAPPTLARLLERCGFEVSYNRYCGFFRSLGNVAYNILVLRCKRPWLFHQVERTGLANLGFYLNLYDIMYVIARRR